MDVPPKVPIVGTSSTGSAVTLSWLTNLDSRYELWWSTTAPLSEIPHPHTETRYLDLPKEGASIPIPIDPRARVVATFARREPTIQGWLITGWQEVEEQ